MMSSRAVPVAVALVVAAATGCDSAGESGSDPRAEQSGSPDLVQLTAKAVERSGIALAKAEPGRLTEVVEAPAEIHFIPSKTAHISPLVAGNLSEVRVGRGEKVAAGDVLAVLSSMDLGEARARLAKAKALVDVAGTETARQKQLSEEGIAAKRKHLEAEGRLRQARAELSGAQAYLSVFKAAGGVGAQMPLKSPIDGVITASHAVRGENVAADTKLFVVTDTRRVWAVGQVGEQDVAKVEVDLEAGLELRAYPGKRWTGKVGFVPCVLDESSRSLKIRVELDNAAGKLRRGLFGTLFINAKAANLADAGSDDVVTVPIGAVQKLGDRRVVFVAGEGAHSFRAQTVKTGREVGGRIEIVEGLSAATSVVSEGAFTLKSQLLRSELGDDG